MSERLLAARGEVGKAVEIEEDIRDRLNQVRVDQMDTVWETVG